MDTNRTKKAAEWFYSTVFRDESITPRPVSSKLPSLLRAARSLESRKPGSWQSRESVFLKQATLLVNYTDDYEYTGQVLRYYPTYESLSDEELRGYFSWRTKLRNGELQKTHLSFAFLYIYELINQIGVTDPMDGYRKLKAFAEDYGRLDNGILSYLTQWLTDYVIYYGLDPELLADSPRVILDNCITVLDHVDAQPPEKVMFAVKQLAPKWLGRSKFYGDNTADCDTVIVRVLRRVAAHYAARCKKSMVEQYFGVLEQYQAWLFNSAVFYDRRKKENRKYAVDDRCVYQCRGGLWTVWQHPYPLGRPSPELEALLKTIDSVMREEFGYGHPVKPGLQTKWIVKAIREEAQALLAEKKAAEAHKVTIDLSRLDRIRRDAAITQEKLTVEEEADAPEEAPVQEVPASLPVDDDCPLSPAEYRLVQCLLYGRPLDWVSNEGYLTSVLVDGINEKLYDTFQDTVLDDLPQIVEDYTDDLKEMVRP